MTEPRRSPQAIFRVIGWRCKPNDGIGTEYSQSEELWDDTDRILAVSVSSWICSSKFLYLNSYKPLFHSDWNILFIGKEVRPESSFHFNTAESKALFDCIICKDEFCGSKPFINLSEAHKFERNPASATSMAGLNPKPPFEIGSDAWFHEVSVSLMFRISIKDSRIIWL